jgi:exonuclease SbcC
MFDFIFKRTAKKTGPAPPPVPGQGSGHVVHPVSNAQTAMAQALALDGDEAAAVDFILQCQFADARLKAAEHVQSRPLLEQVLQHMRNTDRRVTKLVQTRLDTLKQQEAWQQDAQRCVENALRLTQESQLMANQVVDLDRAWLAIGRPPPALLQQFETTRAILRERLQAQADLQHAAIGIVASLRDLADSAGPDALIEAAAASDRLEQQMAQLRASAEAETLPKLLLSEFEQQRRRFMQKRSALEKQIDAIKARQELLNRWEADELAALKPDDLKQAWQALPALIGIDTAPLQARYDALMQGMAELRETKPPAKREQASADKQCFAEALGDMETALQEGALQIAAERDRTLRGIDVKALRPSDAQAARLAKARAELSRLQDWARWGGNVSREELLKASEDLPQKLLAIPELAKKVGSLRERWKSLDASAGPAGKELWERFDSACSTAYAPVAAHFKKLAEERQHNLQKAQALIDEVRQFVLRSNCDAADAAVDWKDIAHFYTRATHAWQRVGTIERKERKRLDSEFGRAMQALTVPLAQQRTIEIKRREQLIAQVSNLNSNERGALDTLRALQERWQEQAKSLPLERRDEQALWQRFRSACDAVFAKRKEFAAAADADRRQNLHAKEAVCAALEAAAGKPEATVLKALREAKERWDASGPVPRSSEALIETCYQAALTRLQKSLDAARYAATEAERRALRDKLRLCQEVETAIVGQQPWHAGMQDRWLEAWQALPSLQTAFEPAMRVRFDRALDALRNDDRQYARGLHERSDALSQELLKCEILSGIESPPQLARERLQLQVAVLQSSLKAGQKPLTQELALLRVCTLPALADKLEAARLERLIENYRGSQA